MNLFKKISFAFLLGVFTLQVLAQITPPVDITLDSSDDVNSKLRENANLGMDGVHWLNWGSYTLEATSRQNDEDYTYDENVFNGNLGISIGSTLNVTGAIVSESPNYTSYAGLSVVGDFHQHGGIVNAYSGEAGVGFYSENGDYIMTGGTLNATSNRGKGFYLEKGIFSVQNGTIQVEAALGMGMHIDRGNFSVTDSTVSINVSEGMGITLYTGDFYMNRSAVNIAVTDGYGLSANNYFINGGTITADVIFGGTGEAIAINIGEDFNMERNAVLNLTITNINQNYYPDQNYALSLAGGMHSSYGSFNMNDGTATISAINTGPNLVDGMRLDIGSFYMNRGIVNAIADNSGSGQAQSIYIFGVDQEEGNFEMIGGTFNAISTKTGDTDGGVSYGVRLLGASTDSGNFNMSGGTLNAKGVNNGTGIGTSYGVYIEDMMYSWDETDTGGNAYITGGILNASADSTGNGYAYGFYLDNSAPYVSPYIAPPANLAELVNEGGNLYMTGGVLNATAMASGFGVGYGVYIENDFIVEGGTVSASAMKSDEGVAHGIHVNQNLYLNGGQLILNPGNDIALYVENSMEIASIATVSPVIDLALDSSMTGNISVNESVVIANGAGLMPIIRNALSYIAEDSYTYLNFSTIDGEFNLISNPFFSFTTEYGDIYAAVTVTKEHDISEILQGNARNIVTFLERNGNNITADPDNLGNLSEFYDDLINTSVLTRSGDIYAASRALSVHTATRFFSMTNSNLMTAFTQTADQNNYLDILYDKNWALWLTPSTYSTRYTAKGGSDTVDSDFENADFHSRGGTLGFSLNYDRNLLSFGFSGFYGDYNSRVSADSAELTTLAGVISYRINPVKNPWVETSLGYAYNKIDQVRDSFGGYAESDVRSDIGRASIDFGVDSIVSSRLTISSSLGVGYTYAKQYAYDEWGEGTLLSVAEQTNDSLKPRFGLNFGYRLSEGYALNIGALYSYETLSNSSDLRVSHLGIADSYMINGEESRHSGSAFAGLTCHAGDNLFLTGRYGISLTENSTTQNVSATFKWLF